MTRYDLISVLVWIVPVIAAACAVAAFWIATGQIIDEYNRAIRDLRRDRQWDRLLQTVAAARGAYDEGPPRTVALHTIPSHAVDTTNERTA